MPAPWHALQVVKEILRYRPPAPMVPQMAQKAFKLTDNYTAPKGTMIVPSVWSASMQVHARAHKCVYECVSFYGCVCASLGPRAFQAFAPCLADLHAVTSMQ